MKVRDTRRRPKSDSSSKPKSVSVHFVRCALRSQFTSLHWKLNEIGCRDFCVRLAIINSTAPTTTTKFIVCPVFRTRIHSFNGDVRRHDAIMPGAVDTLKSNPSKNKLKCVSVSIIINIIENASTMKRARVVVVRHISRHTVVSLCKQRLQWLKRGPFLFIARKQIVIGLMLPEYAMWVCARARTGANQIHLNVNVKFEKSFDDYVRQCGNEWKINK